MSHTTHNTDSPSNGDPRTVSSTISFQETVVDESCDSTRDRRKVVACFYSNRRKALDQIARARKLHRRIRGILHRLPEVLATDVGFLVKESEERFIPEVGIRIHLEEKLSSVTLGQRGLRDLAGLDMALKLEGQAACSGKVFFGKRCPDAGNKLKTLSLSDASSLSDLKSAGVQSLEGYRIYVGPTSDEAVPVDLVAARYFPSGLQVQVGPLLPNTRGFVEPKGTPFGAARVEPLVGGLSVGNHRGAGGTLGAIVWDTTDGQPCILSNWHVLSGAAGPQVGLPCYQPALFDGGDPAAAQVAVLKRWTFGRQGDAALAQLDGSRRYCPGEVLGLWHPIVDAVKPQLGMVVRKWGRSSGFCEGFVDGIDLTLNVEYLEIGIRHYDGQFHIAPLEAGQEVSFPGDSGAIWVTKASVQHDGAVRIGRDDAPLQSELLARKPAALGDLEGFVRTEPGSRSSSNGCGLQSLCDPVLEPTPLQVYLAVGLHFAGDVPGSPLGEHAVATPLVDLSKVLGFSFRPVFQHPDHVVVQQPSVPQVLAQQPRTFAGPAVRQIDTGFRRRSSGPQPDTDPVSGHP